MGLFDLFNLTANVKLNSKDYEIGIAKVKSSTIMVGNLMADMVKKGASMGAGLVKLGLTYNMQMEDYTTNFRVMLGSMEAAEAKVEEAGAAEAGEAGETLPEAKPEGDGAGNGFPLPPEEKDDTNYLND